MARVDVNSTLTNAELLIVQAITAGNYFVYRETPVGDVDGNNDVFTLASAPNPPESLCLFVNGQLQTETNDYSLSGDEITFVNPPEVGMIIRASYTVDPNP